MDWIVISISEIIGIIISVASIYAIMMIFIKINGLRSFAKMSSHDFVVTIAIGSILGAVTIQKEPSILQGALAIATFLALQTLICLYRIAKNNFGIENDPVLLMDGKKILKDNLKAVKMTKNDLIAKLREANVLNYEQVKAVVFEPSGDVSVLHGDAELEDEILCDVIRKIDN